MTTSSPVLPPGTAPATRQVSNADARRLLTDAATLDLDLGSLLVRCRLGVHADWWHLDEAMQLLDLATGVWVTRGAHGTQLLVFDGYDRYAFDVS